MEASAEDPAADAADILISEKKTDSCQLDFCPLIQQADEPECCSEPGLIREKKHLSATSKLPKMFYVR